MRQNWRLNLILLFFLIFSGLVIWRLFYWQIVESGQLATAAENQHLVSFEIAAKRGQILAADNFPLANNQEAYLVFVSLPDMEENSSVIANKIAPFLVPTDQQADMEGLIKERLGRSDLVWVPIKHKVLLKNKEAIEKLKISGIGFEEEEKRNYPEGSASAHLLGFVGSDINGRDKGYFGLEGYYDLELKGRAGVVRREKDASGKPILVGELKKEVQKDGSDLVTTIDRTVQFIIEEKLEKGLTRYGAKSGTVSLIDPKTGAIVAMASNPAYDPTDYFNFEKQLYPNPVVASAFEPGSIFKVLVMAAALNEQVVEPETKCNQCDGPRTISDYKISTWNEKYYPNTTMTEIIQHSDNVGMVFVGEKLGIPKMVSYLEKFGIGKPTGIDLQEESSPKLRPENEWRQIDLATASFGQGIALTPIQMLRAVGAIANGGKLVRPFVVQKINSADKTTEIKPKLGEQVIKPGTARMMTEMMVNAVDNGEAKWAKPKDYRIAGKTGTAQIAVSGHYDEEKTIASFVGFAPADNPKFVMLVTLREPSSSPWGSETAAPLWFDIAKELFNYYGILPE